MAKRIKVNDYSYYSEDCPQAEGFKVFKWTDVKWAPLDPPEFHCISNPWREHKYYPCGDWPPLFQYSEMAYFDRVQPGEDFWVQTDWIFSGLGAM